LVEFNGVVSKLSLKAVVVGTLCVCGAFLFAACVKPVSLGDFLSDGTVGTGMDIGYKNPPNNPPVLKWTDSSGKETFIEEDDTVSVTKGDIIPIEVVNFDDYDGEFIEWYCQDDTPKSIAKGIVLLVNTVTDSIFKEPDIYPISVTGKTEGVPHSTLFFINVE
jgi:hypothetical protein